MNKKDVGERLKYFAKNKFGSVNALAKELGMQRQQLYGYFVGNSYPGGEMLIKLGKLGCDINWLLMGVDGDNLYSRSVRYYPVEEPLKLSFKGNVKIIISSDTLEEGD